jgi:hypothetical protein
LASLGLPNAVTKPAQAVEPTAPPIPQGVNVDAPLAAPAAADEALKVQGIDINGFVADVRRAGKQGQKALAAVVRRVDSKFDLATIQKATFFNGKKEVSSPFAGAGVFYGQMDEDPGNEAIVQIRHHTKAINDYERNEAFWIGIFDSEQGSMVFVESLQHMIWHCAWDDSKLGLLFGFTEKEPGPKASLWIKTQDAESCGTNVSIGYKKTIYRLKGRKLEATASRAPERMAQDRTAHLKE